MTPKFTPGPWTYALNQMGHIWWILAERARKKTLRVAEVMGGTREADARLIAAAPDMHEALTAIHEATTLFPEDFEHALGLVRAALAKANGEAK